MRSGGSLWTCWQNGFQVGFGETATQEERERKGEARIETSRLAVRGFGARKIPHLGLGFAQVAIRLGKVRLQSHRRLHARGGFFRLAQ